jgi:hypothetical protein
MTRRRLTDEERVASRERSNALTRARMTRYRARRDEKRRAEALKVAEKCGILYRPTGQAGEYASLATNPYRGCGHGCVYCYVPTKILRMKDHIEFDKGAVERPGYIDALRKDAAKWRAAGVTEQVMLCFSTDPYHNGLIDDTSLTRASIEVLQEHGFGICTLTKRPAMAAGARLWGAAYRDRAGGGGACASGREAGVRPGGDIKRQTRLQQELFRGSARGHFSRSV